MPNLPTNKARSNTWAGYNSSMIDTSKIKVKNVEDIKPSTMALKLDYDLKKRPFTLTLSYIQIVLAILAGYIIFTYSTKTSKDAWGGLFAIVPLFLIVLSSPVMIICAVYYFVRKTKGSLYDRVSIVTASLMSIVALYIAG